MANPEVLTVHIVQDRIARRQWRSETEREIRQVWRGHPRAVVERVLGEVRRMYDEAGAGYAGRFQG